MYLVCLKKKNPQQVLTILVHYLHSRTSFSGWMTRSSSLVIYSSALPLCLLHFSSPFLPREAAKNIFFQTVKCAGENERLRSQSCQDLVDCLCVRVFKKKPSDEMLEELVKSFDTPGFTGVYRCQKLSDCTNETDRSWREENDEGRKQKRSKFEHFARVTKI